MLLDPQATICRRAWLPCPNCADGDGCPACGAGTACPQHWRFLLDAAGRELFVQCPACRRRWWHDTGFGTRDRPAGLDELPVFPFMEDEAA